MPSCFPALAGGRKPPRGLQVHAIVEQPITPLSLGRIRCTVVGPEPIAFRWTGPDGFRIPLDATGSDARDLIPGRYDVHVEAADCSAASVALHVAPVVAEVVTVSEYVCTPASSGVAFDGSVRARGHGLEQWGRYLWSNGVETDAPVLRDARPGWYSLTLLPVGGATAPTLVQSCPPGRVDAARITRL